MIYFFLFILLKFIFLISGIFIYPIVYFFRYKIRSKKIWVEKCLYEPKKGLFFAWIFLNDSEYLDGTYTEYGDSKNYFPKWIWKSNSEFLKSYWFNAIRNSAVNFNNWFGKVYLKRFITEKQILLLDGYIKITIRKFETRNGKIIQLPTLYIYFIKRFSAGFSRSGRFWIELFKEIKTK